MLYLMHCNAYPNQIKTRTVTAAERYATKRSCGESRKPEKHLEQLRHPRQMLQLVMDNVPQHIYWKTETRFISAATPCGGGRIKQSAEVFFWKKPITIWLGKRRIDVFYQFDRQIVQQANLISSCVNRFIWLDGKKRFDTTKFRCAICKTRLSAFSARPKTLTGQIEEERRLWKSNCTIVKKWNQSASRWNRA